MASPAKILANQLNALKSTGPRTPEGKERSKRNALTHGLTATVVIPGEEAMEVAFRVALMQDSLAQDDDGMALILAERAGYLSMRLKRCFRHEEALMARRMRDAEAAFDDEQNTALEHILSYIANEPPTGARQLRATPYGVDLLIRELAGMRSQVDDRWSDFHCYKTDEYMGNRSCSVPYSRLRGLTNLFTNDDPAALPPGEVAAIPLAERKAWALIEIGKEIDAEIQCLHAHRLTLDHARFATNRKQAVQRAIQGVDKEMALAKKYEAAAELAFDRTFRQLTAYRRSNRPSLADERRHERAETDYHHGAEAIERRAGLDALLADPTNQARLGSFLPPAVLPPGPIDASTFTISKPTLPPIVTPETTPKPPRYRP